MLFFLAAAGGGLALLFRIALTDRQRRRDTRHAAAKGRNGGP
jgi:hypothetical protein